MLAASFVPVEIISGDLNSGILLIADHAMRHLPSEYGSLGLTAEEFDRHIAYDIGVEALTRGLAERLHCPAVMARFSRLLIDPNRGEDDPTLIRQLYDGAVITGNYPISDEERLFRLTGFFRPFRQAVAEAINAAQAATGRPPMVISVHSFTPSMGGRARPWHAGILWDKDPRVALPLIKLLEDAPGLTIGNNEPYDGALHGDTLHELCTKSGIAHALIEVRQDLIGGGRGVLEWADRLAPMLARISALEGIHDIQHFGTRANP